MAITNKELSALFSKSKKAEDITAKLETAQGQQALLQPLSKTVEDNALTFTIRGYFDGMYGSSHTIPFVTAALDALEKAEPDPAARAAILGSANSLGQTAFHMTMRYGGNAELFDLLSQRLEQWAGKPAANSFLYNLLAEPLGEIEHDISYALQDVRNVRPWGTPEAEAISRLCTDSYKPATLAGLTEAVDAARPLILEWAAKNPPKAGDSYSTKKHASIVAFANDLDAVMNAGTVTLQAFPGPMYFRLLELQQQFVPLAANDRADSIFAQLVKQDPSGNTPMHTTWQNSLVMGPPSSAGMVTDSLGPLIAKLDAMLGTENALPLVSKLLQLPNAKGDLPLDNFQYNDLPRRDYYVEGFLTSLRKELGSKEKFTQYVKEVVAAVLPADYRIAMNAYEPAEINSATGQPKPKRGASLDW